METNQQNWNTRPEQASPEVVKLSAATTLTPQQRVIEADCDAASFTITLPPLSAVPHGHIVTVVGTGGATGDVTLSSQLDAALDGDGAGLGELSTTSLIESGEIVTVMAVYNKRWVVLEDTTAA